MAKRLQRGLMLGVGVVVAATAGVLLTLGIMTSRSIGSRPGEWSEDDHPDRKLTNEYILRGLTFHAYRVKWGPDFMVLPTTGQHHGILQVAVIRDIVVGPVVDMGTPDQKLVGWFWLDTTKRAWKEPLTQQQVEAMLAERGLKLPERLTPAQELPLDR